jgi:hypothetical protein
MATRDKFYSCAAVYAYRALLCFSQANPRRLNQGGEFRKQWPEFSWVAAANYVGA